MKIRKIVAGMSALAIAATMAITAAAEDYKGQILIQTGAWSYRNKVQDTTYGGAGDGDWDGKFICWVDNVATDWNDVTESGPVAFEDVTITGDGTYTVKMTGDLTSNSDALNILGVSTTLPRSNSDKDATFEDQDVKISDVKVKIDGADVTIPGEGVAVMDADTTDQINILVANQWNDALGKEQLKVMPTQSIEITFTVSGLGGAAETPEEKPTESTAEKPEDKPADSTADTTPTTTPSTTPSTTPATPAPSGDAATPADGSNTEAGAAAGIALAGLAVAGAAVVATKKRK